MDNREKLVELISVVQDHGYKTTYEECSAFIAVPRNEVLADHLIANGVTVIDWRPVSDPPKAWRRENGDMINYLIYTPEFGVDIGNYAAPANCWLCVALPCKPTHWAYLPQPPKGE